MTRGFISMKGLTVVALATLALGWPAAASAQKEVRIATVDMQRALQTVKDGMKARSELESAFNKKKGELQKEEAELKQMHEELKKQSMVLSEKAMVKKQSEMQERVMKFQEKTARSQAEIQQKEQELTAPIIDRLRKLIGKAAQDKGYTMVLERNENNVLFSLDEHDMTESVIELYNKGGG